MLARAFCATVRTALQFIPFAGLPIGINQADSHQTAVDFVQLTKLHAKLHSKAALPQIAVLVVNQAIGFQAKNSHKVPAIFKGQQAQALIIDHAVIDAEPRKRTHLPPSA